MQPEAITLLDRAKSGERLTSRERRHCISYMAIHDPGATNISMAALFQVSERMVRLDKKSIREERAKLLKEDDVGLIVADISIAFDQQIADIETAKRTKQCVPGSLTYLRYCESIINLRLKTVEALQTLGFLPRNLGQMTVDKFQYEAVVSKDGSVSTQPSHLIPERVPARIEQAKTVKILEAEFTDEPRQPGSTSAADFDTSPEGE